MADLGKVMGKAMASLKGKADGLLISKLVMVFKLKWTFYSKIEEYALKYCDPESDLLNELNRQTHLQIMQPRMLSGHLQGRILVHTQKQ